MPGPIDPVTGLPVLDPVTDLPIRTLTSLNAADNNGGTTTGDLVITYAMENGAITPVDQTTTVAGHFTGTNAQTGVERINFNNATYAGYLLSGDYFVNRADPNNRDAGGIDMTANAITNNQQNFISGENGTNDEIIGGLLNDLIFGGTGDNELSGGAGDDLLVGGSGAGDNDILDGGLDADTMVGLNGNDTYIVDDLLDVVIEALNQGTDTVETLMAELSIETMANVENLTYTGADADQFIGTGNALANVISGGDLADTLSGLGGNDRLDGGLGADLMTGGADNDTYVVDDAGDQVVELAGGGTDTVESSIDYTLAADLENLDPDRRSGERHWQCQQQYHPGQWSGQPALRPGWHRHAQWRRRERSSRRRRRQRHPQRRRRYRHHHRRRGGRHDRCGRRCQHHRLQRNRLR